MPKFPCTVLLPLLCSLFAACASTWSPPRDPAANRVRAEVAEFLARIPPDIAREGPRAWRRHLLDDKAFFMATYGALHLRSGEHALRFVDEIAPKITQMELTLRDVRIEPLAEDLAAVSAGYAERATLADGGTERFAGWFTGVAVKTRDGWRLQHAHWSDPIDAPGHEPRPW